MKIKNSILTFLIFSILISISHSTQLTVFLNSRQTFCFTEDIPRHTMIKITTSAGNNMYMLQIIHNREVLENMTTTEQIVKKMTTQRFGIYKFCLTNEASFKNYLTFQFVIGVHAKDFSSHTEGSDYLASLQNQARIAQVFINQFKQENRQGLQIMSERSEFHVNRHGTEFFLSLVFIGFIVFLSYLQYNIVTNHMINRKYI